MDTQFRNKINLIPEVVLIVYGFISSKYSLIFYGCLVIALLNVVLNAIAKKIAIKDIKNNLSNILNPLKVEQSSFDLGRVRDLLKFEEREILSRQKNKVL